MVTETELISIFAVSATVSVTSLALVVALRQLSIHNQTSRVTIFTEIKKEVATKDAREARNCLRRSDALRRIRSEYEETHAVSSFEILDERTENIARDVAIMYDVVGFILHKNPKLEQEVFEWHSDAIAEMWLTLRPLANQRWPEYWAPLFRELGPRALNYRINHNLPLIDSAE